MSVMKKHLLHISMALLFAVGIISCEEDDGYPSGGTPVVRYVRPCEIDKADSMLVSSYLGTQIAIVGEGFAGVNKIYFNDQKAKLNPTMVTENAIIVTIPDGIPTVKEDLIKLYTSEDSCYYTFETLVPSPEVKSISFEYAEAGDIVEITGSYFVDDPNSPIEVTFTGDVQGEVLSSDMNSIEVVVPEGVEMGPITVVSAYGEGSSIFQMYDETGRFITGDNTGDWNWWGYSDFDDVDGVDGAYVKFVGNTGSWSWPDGKIQLFYINADGTPLASEGNVSDYALKFECKCNEWHDTPLVIWFDTDQSHNVDGEDAQYHWRPYLNDDGTTENYVTDGWITVTIPLEDFIYNKDESSNERSIASLEQLVNLSMMWFGDVDGDDTDYGLNIWMDNLRIAPIE